MTADKRVRVMLVVAGGGFHIQAASLLKHCPGTVDLLVATPPEEVESYRKVYGDRFRFISSRKGLRQSRRSTVIQKALALVVKTYYSFRLILSERPEWVISVGQRASVFMLLAGRLTGAKTMFIECLTRITTPSVTGMIIDRARLADRFYVQWPESRRMYRKAQFRGRLL